MSRSKGRQKTAVETTVTMAELDDVAKKLPKKYSIPEVAYWRLKYVQEKCVKEKGLDHPFLLSARRVGDSVICVFEGYINKKEG